MKSLIKQYGAFAGIFLIAFLVYCSNQMIGATISKFASYMGATAAVVGTVAGSFQMFAIFIKPVTGQAVDNANKRHLLSISMLIILISTIGLMLSKTPVHLILFRGLNGLGWGIGSTLLMTIAIDSFPKDRINTGIGIYSMGQTIAQAIAPSIGLMIVNVRGYSELYCCNVVLMLIAFVLSFFVKVDNHVNKEYKYSFRFKDFFAVEAWMPASLQFCNQISYAAVTAFLVLFAESIGIANIGFYFTIRAVVLFVSRIFISPLADKVGTDKILIPCELLQILSFIFLIIASTRLQFALSAVLMGISLAGASPTLMSLCVTCLPDNQKGKGSNTNYLVTDLGGFIGSNIAGIVAGLLGYRNLFAIFISPTVLCLALYIMYAKKLNRKRGENLC